MWIDTYIPVSKICQPHDNQKRQHFPRWRPLSRRQQNSECVEKGFEFHSFLVLTLSLVYLSGTTVVRHSWYQCRSRMVQWFYESHLSGRNLQQIDSDCFQTLHRHWYLPLKTRILILCMKNISPGKSVN